MVLVLRDVTPFLSLRLLLSRLGYQRLVSRTWLRQEQHLIPD